MRLLLLEEAVALDIVGGRAVLIGDLLEAVARDIVGGRAVLIGEVLGRPVALNIVGGRGGRVGLVRGVFVERHFDLLSRWAIPMIAC
ncbi:MAG: hypothetical protein ABI131_01535 [Nostocoides sp.]